MKKSLLLFCLLLSSSWGFGQINLSQSNPENRWHVGGNIGLNFGSNDYFGIGVAPSIRYDVSKTVDVGMTVGYQYTKHRYSKQHLFEGGPFVDFYPFQNIFLRAHYEFYTGTRKYKEANRASRDIDEHALWLGAGYHTSGRVQFHFGLMYNVLKSQNDHLFKNGLRPIAGVSVGI